MIDNKAIKVDRLQQMNFVSEQLLNGKQVNQADIKEAVMSANETRRNTGHLDPVTKLAFAIGNFSF